MPDQQSAGKGPWRIVVISQIAEVAALFARIAREHGHEPLAHLCARRLRPDLRPPPSIQERTARTVLASPPELDLLLPSSKAGMARLLRAYEPDLALCFAFPWRIPADALAVPRLGIVNCHPSLLPAYRGPTPLSWAVRNGEREAGVSFHLMDEQFDTGPLLAQAAVPLLDEETMETLEARLAEVAAELLPGVLDRLARGERGEPQGEQGAAYQSLFEPEFALVDASRSAEEVHNQVRAWRITPFALGERGPILKIDGARWRVLRTSLTEADGRRLDCADGPLWILETEPA
jgi:methionyl-tRNA formyltransferase